MKLRNPHDKFFKESFGNVAVARDFLLNYCPQEVLQVLDLSTLEPQKDSFLTPELEESFSDLLFKVNICQREGYLYLLFEHKGYPDKGTTLQLLRYMLDIWEAKRVKERAKKLPIVLPLVIYHDERQWNSPTSLGELLDGYEELPEAVKAYVPNFNYLFYDLSNYTDEEIRGEVQTRILLTLFRDIKIKSGEAVLLSVFRAFRYLEELEDKQSAVGYVETMLRYIYEGGNDLTKEDMSKIIKRLENHELKGSDLAMTLAEILRNEGREEGRQEGRQEGEMQALSRMTIIQLTQKFGELPEELKHRISQANIEALNQIVSNIFTISDLDEVKGYLFQ
ncbi:Rpn family recombination-promoting nuclease/putative transposase [Lysinibacillus macroides]|uniref:Transposase n=1 Tax=Lysinibacillus macroides TaxID=33935 RepID=A0A0M9DLC7_9BACI|nr:Rpn family recombination-promoting nuclease/putative transposase [Lysinibacillus macroides]KOY82756.1 transposase [Lysinibacillus macroides]QPR66197.1 Rpn family recombination-promoting nuclease/putative transposase [Lysinibacillus macroides]